MSRPSFARPAMLGIVIVAVAISCNDELTGPSFDISQLTDYSITPVLVKDVMPGVRATALLSSDDVLTGTPAWVFGGSIDGMGLLRNDDDSFTLVANNEDNFSVSRVTFDKNLRPIAGNYLMNSDGGRWRLCSATLATPDEHGFGPLFITAGESGTDPMIHGIDPRGGLNSSRLLAALGRWNSENAVPLPKTAFPGKTVILIGDDDSGAPGGQVGLYVANTVGDLDGGSLYVMARENGVTRERDMVVGQSYRVAFKKIDGQTSLTTSQLNTRVTELGAIVFGRVEDVDYRRKIGDGREIYFNVTGQAKSGVNADFSRAFHGRVYRLVLDAADPTHGSLEVALDADDPASPARLLQDPDNITATENYLYISEDPNEYGDETHDGYLWQYNLVTKAFTKVFEIDHKRDNAKFNTAGASPRGSWESSGMIDVSDRIGLEGAFLIGIQAHSWHSARFKGVDGGTIRPSEDQGSQLLLLTGLPR